MVLYLYEEEPYRSLFSNARVEFFLNCVSDHQKSPDLALRLECAEPGMCYVFKKRTGSCFSLWHHISERLIGMYLFYFSLLSYLGEVYQVLTVLVQMHA